MNSTKKDINKKDIKQKSQRLKPTIVLFPNKLLESLDQVAEAQLCSRSSLIRAASASFLSIRERGSRVMNRLSENNSNFGIAPPFAWEPFFAKFFALEEELQRIVTTGTLVPRTLATKLELKDSTEPSGREAERP